MKIRKIANMLKISLLLAAVAATTTVFGQTTTPPPNNSWQQAYMYGVTPTPGASCQGTVTISYYCLPATTVTMSCTQTGTQTLGGITGTPTGSINGTISICVSGEAALDAAVKAAVSLLKLLGYANISVGGSYTSNGQLCCTITYTNPGRCIWPTLPPSSPPINGN